MPRAIAVSGLVSRVGELSAESLLGSIDEVSVVGGEPVRDETFPLGALACVRGWLVNRETGKPVDRLEIAIGTGAPVEAVLGFRRQDVHDALDVCRSSYCGYYAVVPIDGQQGEQRVMATGYVAGRALTIESGYTVNVAKAVDPIARLTERSDGWAYHIDGFFSGERCTDVADAPDATILSYEQPAMLRFWAIDVASGRPPAAVIARLGGSYLPVFDSGERMDAAVSVGLPSASKCGYNIPVVPSLASTSTLQIYTISADGTYFRLRPIAIRQSKPLASDLLPDDASVRAAVDEICVGSTSHAAGSRIVVGPGMPVTIRGWAVDERGPRLSGGVEARIDDSQTVWASGGTARPDIASLFDNTTLAESGFVIPLDTASWRTGTHHVELRAFSARADRMKRFAEFTFVVEPQ